MRTNILLLSFFVVCLLTACEKEKNIQLTDIQFTECKSDVQKIQSEDITFEYIDGYLYVTHKNASVNCGFSRIDVLHTMENDTIVIDESEYSTENTDCICYTDISYKIGPIPNGEYTLIIKLRGKIVYNQIQIF